jgi:hypothetical protein
LHGKGGIRILATMAGEGERAGASRSAASISPPRARSTDNDPRQRQR